MVLIKNKVRVSQGRGELERNRRERGEKVYFLSSEV